MSEQSSTQVYWRIRRADGKYWSDYGWREIWVASAYSRRPSTEDLDPTARVVRVTVKRKGRPHAKWICTGCGLTNNAEPSVSPRQNGYPYCDDCWRSREHDAPARGGRGKSR